MRRLIAIAAYGCGLVAVVTGLWGTAARSAIQPPKAPTIGVMRVGGMTCVGLVRGAGVPGVYQEGVYEFCYKAAVTPERREKKLYAAARSEGGRPMLDDERARLQIDFRYFPDLNCGMRRFHRCDYEKLPQNLESETAQREQSGTFGKDETASISKTSA